VRRLLPLAFAAASLTAASVAHADVTTWLAFGGGLALDHSTPLNATNLSPAFSASMGVGSDPTRSWVLGGVFRSMSRFNEGTDINLSLRFTTGGFSRGDWGFGIDLGPGLRLWEHNAYGTYPLQGAVLLGAPWGLQVSLGSDIVNLGGSPAALGGYAVLEFDLLRFTLLRQGSTDAFWKLPLPAGGRDANDGH
jgi:hypothetical protein